MYLYLVIFISQITTVTDNNTKCDINGQKTVVKDKYFDHWLIYKFDFTAERNRGLYKGGTDNEVILWGRDFPLQLQNLNNNASNKNTCVDLS